MLSNLSCNPGVTKFGESHLHSIENQSQRGAGTWLAVLKEADELVCLHENAGSSLSHSMNSEGRRYRQGIFSSCTMVHMSFFFCKENYWILHCSNSIACCIFLLEHTGFGSRLSTDGTLYVRKMPKNPNLKDAVYILLSCLY